MTQPVASARTPQIQYQKSADCGSPIGYLESDGVCGETTNFLSGKKNRLTLPCDSTAHMTLRERWVVKIGHYSQKLLPVICYFQVPSKSVACQMGCDLTVSCPDNPPTCCVLGQVICSFLIWTGKTCYMSSLNRWRVMNTKFIHFWWPDFSIFHHNMLIWKAFLYLLALDK